MAINDPSKSLDYLIYMLKYDSVHGKLFSIKYPFIKGKFNGTIEKYDKGLIVNG